MYRFTWLGLAEGVVPDHRQSLTIVGFNLQALTLGSLPSVVPVSMIGLVESGDDADLPFPGGAIATVSIQVQGPNEALLVAGQQSTEIPPPQWPDLPSRVQIVIGLGVNMTEYGRYVAQMSVQLADWPEPQVLRRSLHVRPTQQPPQE